MIILDENTVENGDVAAISNTGDRVDTPNPNDVLCGRGGNINSHQGNEQFRSFVEKRKRVYLTARFKREKRLIASSIVNEIRAMNPPGRFLARKGSMKDNSGHWYDIGDEKARDKTSQALRENAPSIRAEIETEINQQRAEMRRQETAVDQPSSSSKTAANDSPYSPPQLGHHHANIHGPSHHGQQHGRPPPPPPPRLGHSYNPAHQNHYTQQYYDYYYHYYGYGAPPPPPPPGYTSSGAAATTGAVSSAPLPQPGYPPAPSQYWAGQSNPNANTSGTSTPPVTTSASSHPSHPTGSIVASAASASPPHSSGRSNYLTNATTTNGKGSTLAGDREIGKKMPSDLNSAAGRQHSPHDNVHDAHNVEFSSMAMQNQEEGDRRLAMALQQEENVKAFEDRNRRFGSDRRSSRSTAYCAPGYRPRLLNDSIDVSNGNIGSSSSKKKRPAMSASHFFGPSIASNKESTTNFNNANHRAHNGGPSAPNNANTRSDTDTNIGGHFEMDLKPAAIDIKQEENNVKSNIDMNDDVDHDGNDNYHHHDFSCSSFSSRGRLQFKDDSDIMSLFGEGDTIIPPSNANSTGSFNRVRNTFAVANSNKNTNGNHHFNPISLDEGERNHRRQQHMQQRDGSRSDHNDHNQNDQQQNHQDSSLLSQVAHHILGNFGGAGNGSSWTESDAAGDNKNPSNNQDHLHHNGDDMGSEAEMELGQEVIMDVRDESSSMPPPHARGSGTQIDWPSRAGCHSWIPDAIKYNNSSSSHFEHHDNNRDPGNHDSSHHHAHDHSLTRQTSYSRADISPINSMDMDFSQSSNIGGHQRTGINNLRSNGGAHPSSSLMNVFDQKNEDSNPEELLPQIHRSILQRVPSWERSYRSRSPVSLGDISGANQTDDSLIRVDSNVVKDKLFGIVGKNAPSSTSTHQARHRHQIHHPSQGHHHQSPIKLSAVHRNHNVHQDHHNQEPSSLRSQNFNGSRDVDMDWD